MIIVFITLKFEQEVGSVLGGGQTLDPDINNVPRRCIDVLSAGVSIGADDFRKFLFSFGYGGEPVAAGRTGRKWHGRRIASGHVLLNPEIQQRDVDLLTGFRLDQPWRRCRSTSGFEGDEVREETSSRRNLRRLRRAAGFTISNHNWIGIKHK